MTIRQSLWTILPWALVFLDTIASADAPSHCFEVLTVNASRVIKHEVDLKGPFDQDRVERLLVGPELFSHEIGFDNVGLQQAKAYLNWFKIAKPAKEPKRIVTIRDALQTNGTRQLTIKALVYLLSPAQRLTSGSPSPIPDNLNHFLAYEIADAPETKQQLKLGGAFGPENRTSIRAVFLCVPAEQWHHDEHAKIKNAKRCLVVYELFPQKHATTVNTIDQFGLNKLETVSSNWLGVDAVIVKQKSMVAN